MKRRLLLLPLIALLAGCPMPSQGNLCSDSAIRCDDENPCTTDSCVAATGVCSNIVIDCPAGESCNRVTGVCE